MALNVGGDEPVSLAALAEAVVAASDGGRYEIREFPPERKRIDIGDYEADDRLFRQVTGWQPRVTLAQGLTQSLAYFRQYLGEYL